MGYQLLHNNWFGKALGFTCAWIWAPDNDAQLSILIILGIAVGHLYDAWALQQASQQARKTTLPPLMDTQSATTSAYVQYLYSALGYIAKAGGRVRTEHIQYTEQLIARNASSPANRQQAISWFDEGKRGSASMAKLARQCWGKDRQSQQQRNVILQCMCDMASIAPSNPGLNALKHLGVLIGFAPALIGKEFGAAKSRSDTTAHSGASSHGTAPRASTQRPSGTHRRTTQQTNQSRANAGRRSSERDNTYKQGASTQSTSTPQPQAELPEEVVTAYRCLDLAPPATPAQVKRAYRRMVSRYHPDRLARNATVGEVKHAEQRMVEMRQAMETLQKHLEVG